MRKLLLTGIIAACCAGAAKAQTAIYTQNFESGSADFTLNTSDLSGESTPNYWVINNVYAGGDIFFGLVNIPDVPNQPAALSANPQSTYMHILSEDAAAEGVNNTNYTAGGQHSYFAAQNTSFSTMGYDTVKLSFWWLCDGNNNTYGTAYYRTSASGAWISMGGADTTLNNTTDWTQHQVTIPGMANQPFVQLGFRFKQQGASGSDPAFAVDAIQVTGSQSLAAPVVDGISPVSSSVCPGSVLTFNATAGGDITSYQWMVPGATPVGTATVNTAGFSFPNSGTYNGMYIANGPGGSDTGYFNVTVYTSPNPMVINTSDVLSASGGPYATYNWLMNGASTGITTPTYNVMMTGYYQVAVTDNNGCGATSDSLFVQKATGVAGVAGLEAGYWIAGDVLYAKQALPEGAAIRVVDMTGRTVFNGSLTAGSNRVSLPATLTTGAYAVSVEVPGKAARIVLRYQR